MQRKARPQVGRPNAMQGTSASWEPQCTSATQMQGTPATRTPQRNARHVWKLGAQTQRKASSQDGRPNEKLICNENVHTREHLVKRRTRGWIRNFFGLDVDFLIRPHPGWVPQCNERHVRKMGAPTQRKARPQDGRPNATQGKSASWAPQRNARHVRKLGTPMHVRNANTRHVRKLGAATQHKARPQDGRPNAKLIRNENVHTREH
jgi:hypothetical protein